MQCLLASILACVITFAAQADQVSERRAIDLELVLAVDNSLSVNEREFALQISGIAEAFDDPEVIDAILSQRGIAVALVLCPITNNKKPALAGPYWITGLLSRHSPVRSWHYLGLKFPGERGSVRRWPTPFAFSVPTASTDGDA